MAGFVGARGERQAAFVRLDDLAGAALDLHQFLVSKEQAIRFSPFTTDGVSEDPILEAFPTDPETEQRMWERLYPADGGTRGAGRVGGSHHRPPSGNPVRPAQGDGVLLIRRGTPSATLRLMLTTCPTSVRSDAVASG